MATPAQESVPIIPRKLLFGNPDKTQARLSPDGSRISYLAPRDGVLNVWVGPADRPGEAQPVTRDTRRGIRIHFWAYTNRHVIYLQDKEGDENWHVYCVDLESDAIRDLTPFDGVQARVEHVSHHFPGEILIALNNRVAELHDIHRVNIETGGSELVLENPGFAGVMMDDQYTPRLGVGYSPEGGMIVVGLPVDDSAEPFMAIGPEDILTTQLVDFDKAGGTLYLIDGRGRDTAALTTLDLQTMEQTLVAENPRVDIDGVMIHPTEKTLQAYAIDYERREWEALDESVAGDLQVLGEVTDGDFDVVSRTLDDSIWFVAYDLDCGPVRYYRYERETQRAEFLFTDREALEEAPLVRMHPRTMRSRDGLELVSYLSLPVGTDPDGDARPEEPLPLVLWVHGGPWARDDWGFDSVHQWLANRGYAVLSVNFRGSTGFGKEFVNAANHEWGGKMHDDLVDAVQWAVAEGIADPERVAIGGGSYGGYATLVGMTMTPEVFACGVDLVGPSNLITLLDNVPEYWIPILPLFTSRVGDNTTEEGKALLLERSPLTYVERIAKPLLIGQGANDPRVKQQESDQIVAAMQERDIPVTYALYSDEGHGFARPENSMSFWAVTEAFLAEHLGGRYEPIGDAFEGSTIEIRAGADQVEGLADVAGDGGS
ncbi:MAG: S9 family peptidase [Armatimonadota bacterium]|jgi:dipeptidyl aminopeptidase/acylaminoacyl peptidase